MRHLTRHLNRSVFMEIRAYLTTMGWVAGLGNSKPLTVIDFRPAPGEPIAPNTVGISLGPTTPLTEGDLGGGLAIRKFPLLIDVYGEDDPTTAAICDDIEDRISGLAAGTRSSLAVYDFTHDPPVLSTDTTASFEQVYRDHQPPVIGEEWKRHWVTLSTYLEVTQVPGGAL